MKKIKKMMKKKEKKEKEKMMMTKKKTKAFMSRGHSVDWSMFH